MRLAVLADIHALLPALETALAEIERESVDAILVAGDMLAGPNPLEVMRRLRGLNCLMIRGNQENYLLRYFTGQAPAYCYTSQQWAYLHWNYRQLDLETLEFIASLPEQRSIQFPGTHAIRMVHGSPRNVSELVFPEKDPALLDLALSLVPEPVLILGHTHRSWQMRKNERLALNPGGLSVNFSGKIGGGYALLNWEKDGWTAELRDLAYDVEAIKNTFHESGALSAGSAIASYWLASIETGINYLPRFVEFAFEMSREAGNGELPYVPDQIWEQADRLFQASIAR